MTPRQREFLALFNSEGVRNMTIGGYAMRRHGFDRTTFDIDLWVDRSAQNASKVARIIEQLVPGSAPEGHAWRDIFQMEACRVEYPLPGKEVDILTGIGEIDFEECYARSTVSNVDGVSLCTLCIQDLLKTKLLALRGGTDAAGRERDQADHDQLRTRLRTQRDP